MAKIKKNITIKLAEALCKKSAKKDDEEDEEEKDEKEKEEEEEDKLNYSKKLGQKLIKALAFVNHNKFIIRGLYPNNIFI